MTPFEGKNRVSSPYGWRTLRGVRQWHAGQDIVGDENPKVRAIWKAVRCEVSTGWNGGRGNLVTLYYSAALRVICQHLADIYVKTGQSVPQGAPIGLMGSTGDSTGAHLHIEVQALTAGRWVAVLPAAYTEVPNTAGTHAGNNARDGALLPPVTDVPVLSTLALGPVSAGDQKTLEQLAAKLRLGAAAGETETGGTLLLLGPMSAGDRGTIEAKAKALGNIPVQEAGCLVTLALGPQTAGDKDTMARLAQRLGLPIRTEKDPNRDVYTQYIGPASPGDRKTLEKTAAGLLLPVAVV